MTEKTESWNSRCSKSVRKQREEIAKRYHIRFGQTEIYCARCGVPIANPLNHICSDLRLKAFRERNPQKKAISRGEKRTDGKYTVQTEMWPYNANFKALQGQGGGYLRV